MNRVINFFFPKTNGLQYLAAFTVAGFFATNALLSADWSGGTAEPSTAGLAGVAIGMNVFIALLGSIALYEPKHKHRGYDINPRSHIEQADAFKISLLGIIWLMFSIGPIEFDLQELEGGPEGLYLFFKIVAGIRIIRASFWYFQYFFIMLLIRDRKLFKRASPVTKFIDMFARFYDNAYLDAVPTKKGSFIAVCSSLAACYAISLTSIEPVFQPLLAISLIFPILTAAHNIYSGTLLRKYSRQKKT